MEERNRAACILEENFRIQRQLRSYRKEDPPPLRVKPIPIQVIHTVLNHAFGTQGLPSSQAIADMIVIAFFYLLRPGEYTGTTSDNTPFRMQDVQLFIGQRRLDLLLASDADLIAATSATLTFTTQKNGVRLKWFSMAAVAVSSAALSLQLCAERCACVRIMHHLPHLLPPPGPTIKNAPLRPTISRTHSALL